MHKPTFLAMITSLAEVFPTRREVILISLTKLPLAFYKICKKWTIV